MTRGVYRRRAQYHKADDAAAPMVDLLYNPTRPFVPALRVVFRASMARLLDLATVARVLAALRQYNHRKREAWWCLGSRKSPVSVRGYEKTEAGNTVARLELVARRGALRELGVHQLSDLNRVDWSRFVLSRLRFVEVDPRSYPEVERLRLTRAFTED